MRESILRRTIDLEEGTENVEALNIPKVKVIRRQQRPIRNRRIESGNSTITTDHQGKVRRKRRKHRKIKHPYLRPHELRGL